MYHEIFAWTYKPQSHYILHPQLKLHLHRIHIFIRIHINVLTRICISISFGTENVSTSQIGTFVGFQWLSQDEPEIISLVRVYHPRGIGSRECNPVKHDPKVE